MIRDAILIALLPGVLGLVLPLVAVFVAGKRADRRPLGTPDVPGRLVLLAVGIAVGVSFVLAHFALSGSFPKQSPIVAGWPPLNMGLASTAWVGVLVSVALVVSMFELLGRVDRPLAIVVRWVGRVLIAALVVGVYTGKASSQLDGAGEVAMVAGFISVSLALIWVVLDRSCGCAPRAGAPAAVAAILLALAPALVFAARLPVQAQTLAAMVAALVGVAIARSLRPGVAIVGPASTVIGTVVVVALAQAWFFGEIDALPPLALALLIASPLGVFLGDLWWVRRRPALVRSLARVGACLVLAGAGAAVAVVPALTEASSGGSELPY